MKKRYIQPNTKVHIIKVDTHFLHASDPDIKDEVPTIPTEGTIWGEGEDDI